MGKTLYITDKDALDVDRVIVSSTGMEYKLLYSCDEIDNYEARLKADMVAMLTDIQLEIEEIRTEEPINNGHGICGWEGKWAEDIIQECSKIIQQKINSLKENSDVC